MVWTELRICDENGKRGLFLPLTEREVDLSNGVRAVIYSLTMVYCFLGVSIAADIFMSSIEAITSRRRQKLQRNGKLFTYKVWNETVANLSLMALGSSAPEIFLSVIDLVRNDFHAGDLGPSTIVGSAAFNLFVIVAVCMLAIPGGDGRSVEQVPVLIVTAVFSLLAYVWLVVIVMYWTPDVVTIPEAALTFLFLPVLIYLSWRVDIWGMVGLLPTCFHTRQAQSQASDSEDGVVAGATNSRRSIRSSSTVDHVGSKNGAMHEFMRMISAGKGVARHSTSMHSGRMSATGTFSAARSRPKEPGVQFLADFQTMSGDVMSKPVSLFRYGDLGPDIRVEFSVYMLPASVAAPPLVKTSPHALREWSPILPGGKLPVEVGRDEGGGKARQKVLVKSGEVIFQSGEDFKEILVQTPEPAHGSCKDFVVQLTEGKASSDELVTLGPIDYSMVKMVPRDKPGKIKFACERIAVPGKSEARMFEVLILRTDGCSGPVRCNFRTESLSALPEYHYVSSDGVIQFADGVTEARLELEVLPIARHRYPKEFLVILDTPGGTARFDPRDDGAEDAAILTVCIETAPCSSFWRFLDWLVNLDSIRMGNSDWFDSVAGVFFVGGSIEEQREASCMDWVFHLIALPWKIFFIFVPSVHYLGGWVCFAMSLVYIALLTGVIADLADLFGCVLQIPDMVTAITFVALGTSMPDLFASKGAAQEDPTADASIVNVTGSNSVNVFLGLGLPWTIAAIYWELQERTSDWEDRYSAVSHKIQGIAFVVEGRDLGFSVLVFSCCCVVGLAVLSLKRRVTGFELGGPAGVKYSVALLFVSLWLAYIGVASWRVLRKSASKKEELIVLLSTVGGLLIFALIALGFLLRHHLRRDSAPPKEDKLREDDMEQEIETVGMGDDMAGHIGTEFEADEGLGEGLVDIQPPLVAMEVPSGSRGRCFGKT